PHVVRIILAPFEPRLLAIDPQLQPVLATHRYLARPQHAAGPALEAQQDIDVVVEFPAGHEAREVGTHRLRLEPRDEAGEVVGMGADVADGPAGAGARRVGAPGGLLVVSFGLHRPPGPRRPDL